MTFSDASPIQLAHLGSHNLSSHNIWHINYNETIASQAAAGWRGSILVLEFNSLIFTFAFIVFLFSRSGRTSLYCFGKNPPILPGTTKWIKFKKFLTISSDIVALREKVGYEGAFYLIYQIYALYLLSFMSVCGIVVLLPMYIYFGSDSDAPFSRMTIRSLPNESPFFWLPIVCCAIYTVAYGAFILKLSRICRRRDPNRDSHSVMRPSEVSARSLFISRGVPKHLSGDRIYYLLEQAFPSYVSHVSVILDLSDYKKCREKREHKEAVLDRNRETEVLQSRGTLPITLRICPGTASCPLPRYCCLKPSSKQRDIKKLCMDIKKLKQEEQETLKRIINHNYGTGRMIIVFRSAQKKANFVRRLRHKPLGQIGNNLSFNLPRVQSAMEEVGLKQWKIRSCPEPDDIDWTSASFPFMKRSVLNFVINCSITCLLVVFTSPVAITTTIAGDSDRGPASTVSEGVISVLVWISSFCPTLAELMLAYAPTLILVIINWALLNVLYYAGRYQPIFTDSGKERKILRISAVYLIFNTIFVPSFAFASIDAVFNFLNNKGEVLDILGTMFLRRSGSFFVNYVIQRALVGTAAALLRVGEACTFAWYRSRAVTELEKEQAVESWEYYCGTQSAMQISVIAVVVSFSTVVPAIVPFGMFYMLMQHYVDKYSLLYVRPKIPGRGKIAQTATHASIFCLLIYQAGMAGFFLVRGSEAQSGTIVVILMLTYIVSIWWYIQDKHASYQDASHVINVDEKDESSALLEGNPADLFRDPVLRESVIEMQSSYM